MNGSMSELILTERVSGNDSLIVMKTNSPGGSKASAGFSILGRAGDQQRQVICNVQ